mmetsp:Transcript_3663/g.7673  ORF Transcript_3663/g.7673 Transcript_3663/m.7673 type:complete len:548 (-) Transcript_3663:81-1724(-)
MADCSALSYEDTTPLPAFVEIDDELTAASLRDETAMPYEAIETRKDCPKDSSQPYKYLDFSQVDARSSRNLHGEDENVESTKSQVGQSILTQKFPSKLYMILSRQEFRDIVAWMPHGRSWKVLKPILFETVVMPLFFEKSNYHSFTRLVNAWSFQRISHGPDRGSYFHELFLRGMPHLQKFMSRLPKSGKKKKVGKEDIPDFYHLDKVRPLPECAREQGSITSGGTSTSKREPKVDEGQSATSLLVSDLQEDCVEDPQQFVAGVVVSPVDPLMISSSTMRAAASVEYGGCEGRASMCCNGLCHDNGALAGTQHPASWADVANHDGCNSGQANLLERTDPIGMNKQTAMMFSQEQYPNAERMTSFPTLGDLDMGNMNGRGPLYEYSGNMNTPCTPVPPLDQTMIGRGHANASHHCHCGMKMMDAPMNSATRSFYAGVPYMNAADSGYVPRRIMIGQMNPGRFHHHNVPQQSLSLQNQQGGQEAAWNSFGLPPERLCNPGDAVQPFHQSNHKNNLALFHDVSVHNNCGNTAAFIVPIATTEPEVIVIDN